MTRPTPPPIDPEVVRWHVVHTRPRCEKKVAAYCEREGIQVCLPLYRSVKKYRGKAVEFRKPLFTGYLFFRAPGLRAQTVRQHQQVARVLVPPDDAEFDAQLGDILRALPRAARRGDLEILKLLLLRPPPCLDPAHGVKPRDMCPAGSPA